MFLAKTLRVPLVSYIIYALLYWKKVKKWRTSIRAQERELDRQIRGIDSQETQVKRTMKQAAKKNDTMTCKILAKEVVRSRKVKERLYTSKAQLNSMVLQLQHVLGIYSLSSSPLIPT